jgi:hypothetical protein
VDGKRSGAVKSADSDASDEDDDLVDPDADRPDFRSLGDEDVDEGARLRESPQKPSHWQPVGRVVGMRPGTHRNP